MFKLKLPLAAATIAALISALLLVGCGFGESTQSRMDKASRHLADGEYRSAEIQLKNILQKQPEDAEAWLLLGQVSLAAGQYADAAEQFTRAQDQEIKAARVTVPLARALIGDRRYEDALALLETEQATGAVAPAQLLTLRGEAHLGLEQTSEAAAAFADALEEQPGFVNALLGQARVAETEDDDARAKARLSEALSADPGNARVLEAQGLFAYSNGACPEAVGPFKKILAEERSTLTPARLFLARAYLADCQIRRGEHADAERNIAVLMKQSPNNAYANYLQALVDVRHEDYKQATIHLQRFLKEVPNSPRGLTLLASVKIAQNDSRLAELYLDRVIGQAPTHVRAIRMLASLYIQEDRFEEAIELLQQARLDNPEDPQVRAMLAQALIGQGETEGGQTPAQDGAELTARDPSLQMDLARTMVQSGDTDAALALLDQIDAVDADDQLKGALLKIIAHLQKSETEKAVAIAEELVENTSDDPNPLRLLARTYVAAGRDDDARDALTRARAIAPDNVDIRFDIGLLALRGQDYARAEESFKTVLERRPDDLRTMIAMARTFGQQGNAEQATSWLRKAHDANPGNRAVAVALVQAYLSANQADKAVPLAESMATDNPRDAALRRLQGVTLLAAGRDEAGLEKLAQAVEMAPDRPSYRLDLAWAELSLDRIDAAIGHLQALRESHPEFLAAAPVLAMAQLRQGNSEAALATAESLAGADDGDVASNTLSGDVQASQGDYKAAAQAYAKAYEAEPSRAVAINLFEARRRAGIDEPQSSLVDWLDRNRRDIAARIALAEWYQLNGRLEESAEQYRAVLDVNAGNFVVLNNLALVYSDQGDERALATARRAYEIGSNNPAVADTLGWILVQRGELDEGITLIRRAAEALPDAPDIQYHLAAALARTENSDNREEAQQILQDVLDSSAQFENRADAQALVQTLTESAG